MNKNAQFLMGLIPTGRNNAMRRPWQPWVDRSLRNAINEANKEGDCIINVGCGYFRPDPEDPADVRLAEEYFAKELHRARDILYKRKSMKDAFKKKYATVSMKEENT